jgi:hypothetical protein
MSENTNEVEQPQIEGLEDTEVAKVGEVVEKPLDEQTDTEGVHLGPSFDAVGDYPERPYSEAVSDEQRQALADAGFPVE